MYYDALVIGAGQAGLAAAYYLQLANLSFLVLDKRGAPGGAWSDYYHSLKLFTPVKYSALPGMTPSSVVGTYPTRDETVAYLRSYAEHFAFPMKLNTTVSSIRRRGSGFVVVGRSGERFYARSIIVATGTFEHPNWPKIPYAEQFEGQVIHSQDYRWPDPALGRTIVVGAGSSAVQIAVELAQTHDTLLCNRTPTSFIPQTIFGKDLHFWFRISGFDWTSVRERPLVPDTGIYRRALAKQQPPRKSMFAEFTKDGVRWQDGSTHAADSVVFATGYKTLVPFLAIDEAIDDGYQPLQRFGMSLTVPGLYFVGFPGQRNFRSATLRGVGPDANLVVRHLQHYLISNETKDPEMRCPCRIPADS